MANLNIAIEIAAKDQASGPIGRIVSSLGGLKNAGLSGLQKAGTAAFGAVATGAGLAVTAVAGLGTAAVGAGSDMDTALSTIAANMNTTKEAIAPLGGLIRDLGLDPNLKVTSVEAAQAIDMLARNGLAMTEIMDGAAHSTVLLANSTGTGLANAANIGTDAMAIFNIEAREMNRAVNGITAVTTNSKFAIDDYGLALAQGGGAAAAAGVEFSDFNTTIAAISPLFASGSDAGTSFKTMIQRLVPASNPAIDAMRELGIITEEGNNRFFDAQGNLQDMATIAGILQSSMAGLSEEQRNQALTTIFGTDAMRAAVGLMSTGEQGFRDLQATMSQTDALQNAATRMDNLGGVMEILSGIGEGLVLTLGNGLLPLFRTGADAALNWAEGALPKLESGLAVVSDTVGTFISLVPGLVEEFGLFGGVARALGETLSGFIPEAQLAAIQTFITRVTEMKNSFLDFISPVTSAVGQFVEWQDVLIGLAAAITAFVLPALWGVVSAVATIAAPVLAVIGVVALLRRAWVRDWGGIQGKVQAVIDFIVPRVQNAIAAITGWWEENGGRIMAAVNTAWTVIKATIMAAVNTIRPAITTFFENIKSNLSAFSPLVENFKTLWQSLKPIIMPLLAVLGGAFLGFFALLSGVFTGIANAVEPFINTIVTVVGGVVDAFTGLFTFLTGFADLIIALFQGNSEGVQEAWAQMGEGIMGIVGGLWTAITGSVTGFIDTFLALIGGLIDGVVTFFQNLYNQLIGRSIIPDMIRGILTAISSFGRQFLVGISNTLTQARNLFSNFGTNITNGIMSGLSNLRNRLNTSLSSAAQFAKDTWNRIWGISSPSKWMAESINFLGQGAQQAAPNLGRQLGGVLTGAAQTAQAGFSGAIAPAGAALATQAAQAAPAASAGVIVQEVNIDARGSNWTREELRKIFDESLDAVANVASRRVRFAT